MLPPSPNLVPPRTGSLEVELVGEEEETLWGLVRSSLAPRADAKRSGEASREPASREPATEGEGGKEDSAAEVPGSARVAVGVGLPRRKRLMVLVYLLSDGLLGAFLVDHCPIELGCFFSCLIWANASLYLSVRVGRGGEVTTY